MTAVEHPAPPPAPARRSWIKWVAFGCVGLLILGALGAAAIMFLVFGAVKRSDAYEGAVQIASGHPAVIAAIGEPIETGFFVSGSVKTAGPGGEASLAIPLEGPLGEGTLYVQATKQAGRWNYEILQFAPEDGGSRIDLLADGGGQQTFAPAAAPPANAALQSIPAVAGGAPTLDTIIFGNWQGETHTAATRFPAGAPRVSAEVHYVNVGIDDEIVQRWYRDGEKIEEEFFSLRDLASEEDIGGDGWFTLALVPENGVEAGDYRLDLWLNGSRVQSGTFVVE